MNHPVDNWPVPTTRYETLFLASQGQLLKAAPPEESSSLYQSDVDAFQMDDDPEESIFKITFTERTYLLGAARVILFMSCKDADDMDVFLQLRKQDLSGRILRYHNIPASDMQAQGVQQKDVPLLNTVVYLGPHGQVRASHRKIDEKLSTAHWIRHEHLEEEKIKPGEVVRIETSIWPGGMIFEPSESLVLKIAGHPMFLAEFPTLRGKFKARNVGKHEVHIGGTHPSCIVVPLVDI